MQCPVEKHLPMSDSDKFKLEKFVPLSNDGNIDIQVVCYFGYENNEENTMHSQLNSLSFKEGYILKLSEPMFNLEANSRTISGIELMMNKLQVHDGPQNLNLLSAKKKLFFLFYDRNFFFTRIFYEFS